MRKKVIAFIVTASVLLAIVVYAGSADTGDYESARLHMTLRAIGHDILVRSGDSTSRLMPVLRSADNTYEIALGNAIAFSTDVLQDIIHEHLTRKFPDKSYIVKVVNCASPAIVVYGYEFVSLQQGSLPCSGRVQEKACYKIQIMFPDSGGTLSPSVMIIPAATLSLLLIGFIVPVLRKKKVKAHEDSDMITISQTGFSMKHQILTIKGEQIGLSDKETRIFAMLAHKLNEVVDRDILMKEIWENDGVFVGRSLDVFISKLRKKIQEDAGLKIVNVHGKGYKLVSGEWWLVGAP